MIRNTVKSVNKKSTNDWQKTLAAMADSPHGADLVQSQMRHYQHNLDRFYAAPKDHPITTSNPAPWKIQEFKLEPTFDKGIKVMIRGEGSMWFNADKCFIGEELDLVDMLNLREHEELIERLSFSMIV